MTKEEREERDLLFCELLFELGSVKAACDQLDISLRQGRKIQERNKNVILEMVNLELASMAPAAVKGMRDALTEDGSIPKAEIRLKAAEDVLDRVGASKKVTSDLEVKVETPVILMPAKTVEEEPVIRVSANAD